MEATELMKALFVAESFCQAHPDNDKLFKIKEQLKQLNKNLQEGYFLEPSFQQIKLSQLQVDLVQQLRPYLQPHQLYDAGLTAAFFSNIYRAVTIIDNFYHTLNNDARSSVNYGSAGFDHSTVQPADSWSKDLNTHVQDFTNDDADRDLPVIKPFRDLSNDAFKNSLPNNEGTSANSSGRDDHAPIINYNSWKVSGDENSDLSKKIDFNIPDNWINPPTGDVVNVPAPVAANAAAPAPASAAAPAKAKGKILYDIPDTMQLGKQHKCVVRIARDERTVKDDDSFTASLKIEDITLSGVMKVELIDISEPQHFNIKTVSSPEQSVDMETYTEWLFWVTPLIAGTCELILKVSGFKMIDGKERRKDILFEKAINISSDTVETPGENSAGMPGNRILNFIKAEKKFKDLAAEKNSIVINPPSVFISYAHKDKVYFDIFSANLLSHSGWNIWTDKNIEIGKDWFERIQDSIKESDFAILLVSADFISSGFIKEHEFDFFMRLEKSKEGFAFLPVLLRDVDFTRWSELSELQFFVAYGDDYGVPAEKGTMIAFAKLCRFDNNGQLIPNDNIDTYFKNFVETVRNDWLRKRKN